MITFLYRIALTISFELLSYAWFPLGEFVRANREKSNLIGWRQTLTTSPANHVHFLLVCAKREGKQLDWLATNADDITSQSHPLFAYSREKNRHVENAF
jgi:hypothetical protein